MSYPTPILNLPFVRSKQFGHPAVSIARASIDSYTDSSGILRCVNPGIAVYPCDTLTGICLGLRAEPATIFLNSFDSQLDHALYTKIRSSVTPNAKTYALGQYTLDKIVEDTSNNTHECYRAFTPAASKEHIFEFTASAAERSKVDLRVSSGFNGAGIGVLFDLAAGSATVSSGSPIAYGVSSLEAGVYRCWVKAASSASPSSTVVDAYMHNGTSLSYAGDGASGVYLGGFQFYEGSYPVGILPTGWETTSATSNSIGTGSKTFTVGNDSAIAGKAIPAGATFRIWQTSNTSNFMTGTVTSHTGTSLVVNVTGTGGSGTGVTDWTVQAGASVTKAATVCNVDLTQVKNNGNPLWNGTEGTIVVRARTPKGISSGSVQALFSLDNGASERIYAQRTDSRQITLTIVSGGVTQGVLTAGTVQDDTEFCIAVSFKDGYFAVSLNGSAAIVQASGSVPSATSTFRIGCNVYNGVQWGGTFKHIPIFNRALPDNLPTLSAL